MAMVEEGNHWLRFQRARLSRRRLLYNTAVAGVGLASLAVVGCGQGASGKGQTRNPGSLSKEEFFNSVSENPPKDWSDGDIKVGGMLVRLFDREPATLDFFTTPTLGVAEATQPVYSKLIRISNRAGLANIYRSELEPDLAREWELPDRTTLVFKLTPGVRFQNVPPLNGRPLTVEDIRYSFERGKTFERSINRSSFEFIDRVESPSADTVRIILRRPNPAMPYLLGSWIMSIMPHEIGDNPQVAQRTAVGTGPFILDSWTPNVEMVYRRNLDYFKKDAQGRRLPYLDGYTLRIIDNPDTRLAVYEARKADFSYVTAEPLTWENAQGFASRNPDIVLQKLAPTYGSFAIIGHYKKEPWSNPLVRRALSMAMDRKSIIQQLMDGHGRQCLYFPWDAIFEQPPDLSDFGSNFQYNPQEAKRLLSAAGYPNGIELDLQTFYPSIADQVLVLQQTAAQAGIKLNVVQSPDSPSHVRAYTTKNWKDLIIVGRGLNYPDPNETLPYYLSGSPQNYHEVDDPELNHLNERQMQAEGDDRRKVLKQIWDRMLDQVYDVIFPSGYALASWWPWVQNYRRHPVPPVHTNVPDTVWRSQ